MSRFAVISDIHGNLHALQAVMSRLVNMNVDSVLCLGDIVGYGPFPDSCIDLVVKHCEHIVRGNHDDGVVNPELANEFNGPAQMAIEWTRSVLGPLHMDALCRLPAVARPHEAVMCVHDSPTPGPTDYVHDKRIAALAFGGVDTSICLLGHTHVPMVFECTNGRHGAQAQPAEVTAFVMQDGVGLELSADQRYICNPGSVGQPRDCDPRASFAILDMNDRTFTVHRQDYDIAGAQAATQRAGLPTVLADRLAIGA